MSLDSTICCFKASLDIQRNLFIASLHAGGRDALQCVMSSPSWLQGVTWIS